jgi:hypothetical protein
MQRRWLLDIRRLVIVPADTIPHGGCQFENDRIQSTTMMSPVGLYHDVCPRRNIPGRGREPHCGWSGSGVSEPFFRMRACVRVRARPMRACVRVRVRACACARVRACACVRVRARARACGLSHNWNPWSWSVQVGHRLVVTLGWLVVGRLLRRVNWLRWNMMRKDVPQKRIWIAL